MTYVFAKEPNYEVVEEVKRILLGARRRSEADSTAKKKRVEINPPKTKKAAPWRITPQGQRCAASRTDLAGITSDIPYQ